MSVTAGSCVNLSFAVELTWPVQLYELASLLQSVAAIVCVAGRNLQSAESAEECAS